MTREAHLAPYFRKMHLEMSIERLAGDLIA